MTEKTPTGLDLLLTVWVCVVGLTYFGGYFAPQLGLLGPPLAVFAQYGFLVYAAMVLVSVLTLALRYLRRSEVPPKREDPPTKKRK